MKVETDYTNADDTAYERIFESYQDMIDLWNEQGIVLYDSLPLEMNQPVGNGDPIYALWTNLVIHASDSFAWMPTQKQLNVFILVYQKTEKRGGCFFSENAPKSFGSFCCCL